MLHGQILISLSKQNCESLACLASHCDERLLRIAKVSVTASDVRNIGKKSISPKKYLFRNAEKFLDIGECTRILSLLYTLLLRYMRKVQRICDEFLADMPHDLISPTFCAVIGTFLLE